MKISRLLGAFLLLLAALPARGEVEWLAKEYNFGVIREADGKVTGSVKLVNHGPDATYISRVRPSCGCTGASYTHNVIEPGDSATVSFTYNPQGRPGPFDKTVKVYMGPANELTVIRISGTVIASEATLDSQFPKVCGPMRFDKTEVGAGELKKGQGRHFFINVYNQGDKTIKPEWKSKDKALEVSLKPDKLAPGETATLTFYLKTDLAKEYGPFEYPVEIWPEGKGKEETTLTLSGVIVPDISKIPIEELENAPQAFLLPEFVEVGEEIADKNVEFEFEVLNDGKTPLKVERVYSRQKGVAFHEVPSEVKPGEKGRVKGIVEASQIAEGPFRLKVEVLTNDPVHPVRECGIVGIKK